MEVVTLPEGEFSEIAFATQFWDETEILAKEAEQINRAMIVPAVSELRYGGRKLVDYLSALQRGADNSRRESLADFVQCCIRARHDAIDAIVSYITLYLEELEEVISADLIAKVFPTYEDLKRALFEAAKLVAESRKDRQRRNEIYSTIRSNHVDWMLAQYWALNGARTRLFAEQQARDEKQHRASLIVAGAISLLAVALTIAIIAVLI